MKCDVNKQILATGVNYSLRALWNHRMGVAWVKTFRAFFTSGVKYDQTFMKSAAALVVNRNPSGVSKPRPNFRLIIAWWNGRESNIHSTWQYLFLGNISSISFSVLQKTLSVAYDWLIIGRSAVWVVQSPTPTRTSVIYCRQTKGNRSATAAKMDGQLTFTVTDHRSIIHTASPTTSSTNWLQWQPLALIRRASAQGAN